MNPLYIFLITILEKRKVCNTYSKWQDSINEKMTITNQLIAIHKNGVKFPISKANGKTLLMKK